MMAHQHYDATSNVRTSWLNGYSERHSQIDASGMLNSPGLETPVAAFQAAQGELPVGRSPVERGHAHDIKCSLQETIRKTAKLTCLAPLAGRLQGASATAGREVILDRPIAPAS